MGTDHSTCGCGCLVAEGKPCPRCGRDEVLPGDFIHRPVTIAERRAARHRRALGFA